MYGMGELAVLSVTMAAGSCVSVPHPSPPQEVDVIFQRILSEIERQFGTQDDWGCTLL